MNLLKQTLSLITPPDEAAMQYAKKQLAAITNPERNFGYLENILIKYAGITRQKMPKLPKKCTVIVCADHGVAEMGVSAYPVETTVHMTRNYLVAKGAVANALSNFSEANMIVVDMGIAASMEKIPGLIDRKIDYGTKNMTKGPAMTRQQAVQALTTGIEIANEYAKKGYQCFLPGEMGIANTTASAAIVATFGNLTPEQATGRGTNISDERLKVKIDVVRQALEVNKPDPTDGIDVLAKVGGFELGCIAGIMLGAAANNCVVMLDGFNTGVAALIANSICPLVKHYLIGSHLSIEPAHKTMLKLLDLKPYINMRFRLGEATGSSIAIHFLDVAIKTYINLCSTAGNKPTLESVQAVSSAKESQAHLSKLIDKIQPLNTKVMEACSLYIDNLTKPMHSLGALEELAIKIAGITGNEKPRQLNKELFIFTAPAQLKDTKNPYCAIQTFAQHASAKLHFIDLPSGANQAEFKLTKQAMFQAIEIGCQLISTKADSNANVFGLGTIDDTCSIDACHKILTAYEKDRSSAPIDSLMLLEKFGTPQIAALVGVILSAADEHCAIVLDNLTTCTAALVAVTMAPQVKGYLITSQLSPEPAHKLVIELLDLPIYLTLHMSIGEGCASALGMKLLDASMHMLNDMKTFGQTSVAVANDGPGAKRQTKSI
ncbi:nicotinate-nucleotide--dimethylbenzimidazole phosphoribosyltransferase [Anaerosinus massiliensis]|uniref:nicotinate-nucleotide--dimethylbenzimidazole phosphoribosyltransferase n=1 Tax=Massilibacillus massiliensis TaxID=1806837 RepID=UPI000A92DF64|nr:nicotinate-nucleotide--dimethylbenzimidazole phosphoribosyltransferase [Massilibacillus massiliensis]